MAGTRTFNRRRHERFQLVPMYTSVAARCEGDEDDVPMYGHAYDISESGARIELDEILDTGDELDVLITVPADHLTFAATGRIVRCYASEDDPGPRRVAVEFKQFHSDDDRLRLMRWLGSGHLQRAA